jgi:uncharacterized protein YcbX
MDTTVSQEHSGEAETAKDDTARLRSGIEELKERIQAINDSAQAFIKEHPAACLMAALGLGYLVARVARGRS